MSLSQSITAMDVARIFSVPAAGFVSGMIACMSFAGIPAVALAQAETASKQWKKIYDLGSTTMPPFVVTIAASLVFLATKSGRVPGFFPSLSFDPTAPRVLYAMAAGSLVAIVPYTIAVMVPTNDILMARATSNAKLSAKDAEIPSLLEKWSRMNYVRAVIVGTGAVLAATANALSS